MVPPSRGIVAPCGEGGGGITPRAGEAVAVVCAEVATGVVPRGSRPSGGVTGGVAGLSGPPPPVQVVLAAEGKSRTGPVAAGAGVGGGADVAAGKALGPRSDLDG